MAVSDALVVGEGWISEHYFSTDAKKQSFLARVLQRRKEWDEAKDANQETTRSRFAASRGEILGILATLEPDDPRLPGLYSQIEAVLGYNRLGLQREQTGPVCRISSQGLTGNAPLAIVHAKPCESVEELLAKDRDNLVQPLEVDESTSISSTARAISHLFIDSDHPDFVLVLAGPLALVAERERWAEGRYLLVDLQLVCERNDDKRGGEVETALTVLDADSLAPNAEGAIWWKETFEESVKHTVGVSADLREGVRLSIEIIANDVVERRRQMGLDPLPADQAQILARQSLRFLYRILFLLYAEASPELGVLPVGTQEYERGYSLDRLRDLTLVELTTVRSERGTHLYQSLDTLFGLVDKGHDAAGSDDTLHKGLTFRSLKADLFLPKATSLIDEVKLGNQAVQRVLRHLLLSKEKRGSDRGFISYSELGINQLGAVYEGLMSYTGFFAETDLYEVAKGGDSSKGSWVVPTDRSDGISENDFVKRVDELTGENKAVLHKRGTFVFRLAGRERQQSASYYTPEVLTQFVVSQALAEMLDQHGQITPAADILELTICEPALGSGAFAIEAVRQLANEYLTRRQKELGEKIDPDVYARELQKVKAYIALHQVYGVDLNETAVELAEISLWLDTMVEGLQAPWFGLHLRRGNSLIGARRTVFTRKQLDKKAWLKEMPRDVPIAEIPEDIAGGRESSAAGHIHHFLLPADGWGAAHKAKEAKELAPDALEQIKKWRKTVNVKPNKTQTDTLVNLGRRVERLWQLAYLRLNKAEEEIRRSVDVWGAEDLLSGGAVTREQIEASLDDANSAYRRLRRVMDAWCAMWFWPLTEKTEPPLFEEWLETLQKILGSAGSTKRVLEGQLALDTNSTWGELDAAEENDLVFAGAQPIDRILADHPWLAAAEHIAKQQGFFHWDLDFAPVFANGGFDLQVGNPPWVRPRSDVEALLAEADPWWQLKAKSTAAQDKEHREKALAVPGIRELVIDGTADVACTAAFLGAVQQYPHLVGLQPDLYRCFMEQTWRAMKAEPTGSVAIVSLESHFTDEKAGPLRRAAYRRMRRHWQFINELMLFEIEDHKRYGISVFGTPRDPDFLQAASLYHPDTVERSLEHNGSGAEPGIKDPEGRWDVRPHASRIVRVTTETLASWHAVLETDETPISTTRMVYAVNKSTAQVLEKLATAQRLSSLEPLFSPGWHEKNDRKKGRFDSEWGIPESWDQVILQGPHIHVATPFFKTPNETMRNNQDWTATDFESLPANAIPATSYKLRGNRAQYDAAYLHWETEAGPRSARDYFRLAWRNMAANTGERTLISALIPPGAAHIHGISSVALPNDDQALALAAGFSSSFLLDFGVRIAPKSTISAATLARLPLARDAFATRAIILRILRMSCVTNAYAELWENCFDASFKDDKWTGGVPYKGRMRLGEVSDQWSPDVALRRDSDRRQAQIEIDALVAIALGITVDELCTIYRTQFPVLFGYDTRRDHFDLNGRLVPGSVVAEWRTSEGDAVKFSSQVFTHTHPQSNSEYRFEAPFRVLDREACLRTAYSLLADESANRFANTR